MPDSECYQNQQDNKQIAHQEKENLSCGMSAVLINWRCGKKNSTDSDDK